MRFIAEFYLTKVKSFTQVVIEAENLEGAADEAEGMVTDYKCLVNVERA